MRNLSLGWRHLVNAYVEVEAGIGVIAGNTVWSMPEGLECEVLQKARYINTLTLYLTLISTLLLTYLVCAEQSSSRSDLGTSWLGYELVWVRDGIGYGLTWVRVGVGYELMIGNIRFKNGRPRSAAPGQGNIRGPRMSGPSLPSNRSMQGMRPNAWQRFNEHDIELVCVSK